MKRWALLTVVLYVVLVLLLGLPLSLFTGPEVKGLAPAFYEAVAPALLLIQATLLLVPVDVAQGRPVKRRKVILSAIVAAFPMAVLAIVFLDGIVLMIMGEAKASPYVYEWPALCVISLYWVIWGFVFYRSYSAGDPRAFTSTVTRWLLRGSILELVVAIPSHIISRRRNECCAPPLTLLGIATGIAVAVMSFGPGVFFLFAKRVRDKRRAQAQGDGVT